MDLVWTRSLADQFGKAAATTQHTYQLDLW
jgi:hypothetical protein